MAPLVKPPRVNWSEQDCIVLDEIVSVVKTRRGQECWTFSTVPQIRTTIPLACKIYTIIMINERGLFTSENPS